MLVGAAARRREERPRSTTLVTLTMDTECVDGTVLSAGATVMTTRLYRPVSEALGLDGLRMTRDDCIQFAKKTVNGFKYPIMGRFIINGLAPIATSGKFDKTLLAHYLANIDIGGAGIKSASRPTRHSPTAQGLHQVPRRQRRRH